MFKAKHFLVAAAICLPLSLASTSAFAVSAHNAQTGGDRASNKNENSSMSAPAGRMMMQRPMHRHYRKHHHMRRM